MTDFPSDLKVLPTAPYNERPVDLPLDVEECRTALWLDLGNVTKAAERLKVSPSRLRAFVRNNAYLTAEMSEAMEQLKDKATDVIREALNGPPERSDSMARYVMSGIGKDRGFGANSGGGAKVTVNGGVTIIQWADGSNINEPQTIEGEVADA